MKLQYRRAIRWLAVPAAAAILFGCATGPNASFRSVNNNPGTFDSDFTGNGGSVAQTFTWTNTATRAEYSMDITATQSGRVDVVIRDADGTQVAAFGLSATSPDDTLDGLTSVGTQGDWTIEVSVQDFTGDGSLNLNSGL